MNHFYFHSECSFKPQRLLWRLDDPPSREDTGEVSEGKKSEVTESEAISLAEAFGRAEERPDTTKREAQRAMNGDAAVFEADMMDPTDVPPEDPNDAELHDLAKPDPDEANLPAEPGEAIRYNEPSPEKLEEIFNQVESSLRSLSLADFKAAFSMVYENSPESLKGMRDYFAKYENEPYTQEDAPDNIKNEAKSALTRYIDQLLPQIKSQPDAVLLFRNVLQIDLNEKVEARKPSKLDYVGIENFDSEVLNYRGGPVVVEFGTSWCKACESQEANMMQLPPNVKKFKVDVEQEIYLQTKYLPQSFPTLVIFEDGKIIETFVGFTDAEILAQKMGVTLESTGNLKDGKSNSNKYGDEEGGEPDQPAAEPAGEAGEGYASTEESEKETPTEDLLTPEARELMKVKTRAAIVEVLKKIEEIGGVDHFIAMAQASAIEMSEEGMNAFETMINEFNQGITDERVSKILNQFLSDSSPEEIEKMNGKIFEFNDETIYRLGAAMATSAETETAETEPSEEEKPAKTEKAKEAPTEEEQLKNKEKIKDLFNGLTVEDFIDLNSEIGVETQTFVAKAFIERVKLSENYINQFAETFKKLGPKAAEKAIHDSYGNFLRTLTKAEIKEIEKDAKNPREKPRFEFTDADLGSIHKSLMASEQAVKLSEANAEDKEGGPENEWERMIEMIGRLLAAYEAFDEYSKGGNLEEGLEAGKIAMNGKDPEEEAQRTNKALRERILGKVKEGEESEAIEPLSTPDLIAFCADPKGPVGKKLIGEIQSGRKEGEDKFFILKESMQGEALTLLGERIGVKIHDVQKSGAETTISFGDGLESKLNKNAEGQDTLGTRKLIDGVRQPINVVPMGITEGESENPKIAIKPKDMSIEAFLKIQLNSERLKASNPTVITEEPTPQAPESEDKKKEEKPEK